MISFNKKINISIIIGLIIILVICTFGIIRVNYLYPSAKVVRTDGSIEYGGCTIQAVKKEIYTPAEYNQAYEKISLYMYLNTTDRDISQHRIVLYTISVTNNNDKDINIYKLIGAAEAYARPSYWSNGAAPILGEQIIKAGDTCEMRYSALYLPSLVRQDRMKNMENNQFSIIFSFYPVWYELVFQ